MWGIIPAAGAGSRIQPLAFSKELLPVGSRMQDGIERPRAVSEYLVERMLRAGVDKLCFVISPGKRDILEYYGGAIGDASICYVVQEKPGGLCDAVFHALPLVQPADEVTIGLPDTIWFPVDGLARLPAGSFSLLLFRVATPEYFDAVRTAADGTVQEIRVKQPDVGVREVWGAMRMPGQALHSLHALWLRRSRRDEYLGTLFNAWLAGGGRIQGVPAGEAYVDVGTVHGYRQAITLLASAVAAESERTASLDAPAMPPQ